jgi:hypothetical protein
MSATTHTISPLRQRMIDDMRMRKLPQDPDPLSSRRAPVLHRLRYAILRVRRSQKMNMVGHQHVRMDRQAVALGRIK